jgi:hypothetical protein
LPLSNVKGTNRKREERGFCPNLSAAIGDREKKNIVVEVRFLHMPKGGKTPPCPIVSLLFALFKC